MPSEVRHLLFRSTEVVVAIENYYRHLGQPLASGLIVGCAMVGEGIATPLAVRLTMLSDNGAGKPSEITIDSAALTAALILFCQQHQIPLPVKGKKSLQRFSDQVCLILTINQRAAALSAL